MYISTNTTKSTAFLKVAPDISLAYHKTSGKTPGVIFCGGFMSDMNGTKATALEEFCHAQGRAFVRFDYRGHGESSDTLINGTIGAWKQDALAVFDQLTTGPQIIIGSSMGGWIATLIALERQERIAALIGIAAAPDFTEDLVWQRLSEEKKNQLLQEGVIYEPSEYGAAPYPITLKIIEEARRHLLMRAPIPFTKPVRLLQGMRDSEVPWQYGLQFAGQLQSDDVRIILIKDGDHRLSRKQDLGLLQQTIIELTNN